MNTYILVEWPEVQALMEESWFKDEAILNIDGNSSYFIPEKRIIDNDYIRKRSEELARNLSVSESEYEEFVNSFKDFINPADFNTYESVLNLKTNLIENG